MQLFITDFVVEGEIIYIQDPILIKQNTKVLRHKPGDVFFVQKQDTSKITRHKVSIDIINKHKIVGKIIDTETRLVTDTIDRKIMLISMPNKRSKAELIVQKLSEIGIQNIILWPSKNSIIKQANSNKMDRLYKIATEATEQSRGWTIPKIEFIKDISDITLQHKTTVIDFKSIPYKKHNKLNTIGNIVAIGPEGGFTESDYEKLHIDHIKQIGDTVLRTETASIISARLLKNNQI